MGEQRSSDGWWVASFVIGVVALILGAVGVALAADTTPNTVGSGGSAATGGKTEWDVTLADISITPSSIEVPAGEQITVHVDEHRQARPRLQGQRHDRCGDAEVRANRPRSSSVRSTATPRPGAACPATRRPA